MAFSRFLLMVAAIVFVLGLLLALAAAGFAFLGHGSEFAALSGWLPLAGVGLGVQMMGWALFAGCLGEIGSNLAELRDYFLTEPVEAD